MVECSRANRFSPAAACVKERYPQLRCGSRTDASRSTIPSSPAPNVASDCWKSRMEVPSHLGSMKGRQFSLPLTPRSDGTCRKRMLPKTVKVYNACVYIYVCVSSLPRHINSDGGSVLLLSSPFLPQLPSPVQSVAAAAAAAGCQ